MIGSFNGKTPRIADSAFVSKAAYVVGNIEIGENSGIWPGTVLRGDSGRVKIGSNSHIQDNSVVHGHGVVDVGDNVLVGHCVVVHGKKIGNHCLIGNNATILEDSEIGDYCVIAAGCVVTGRAKIPDCSLVAGVPGKIIGQITEKQLKWIKMGTAIYTERARQYKEQGL